MSSRWKKAALTSVAAATLAVAMPATDASAINRVDCAGRWDFVNILTNGGTVCYANYGYLNVTIYNVGDVYSGNNDFFYYDSISSPAGSGTRHLWAWTWQSDNYNDAGNRGTVRSVESYRPI
ncbi:beta/gamma crystallin domain-containing protein [Kitasatospora sp. NPDC050543]|uniref:beta/gamma crystallin domain-containing protein n=1 Tax=Kitasatospora sp. NPDC050543 TaxID=3364054 RepID=UPI00379F69E4